MMESPDYNKQKLLEEKISQLEAENNRLQQSLCRQEQKLKEYNNYLDDIPQMISYTDKTLRYRFVNKAYEKNFSVKAEALIGQEIKNIIGKEAFNAAYPHIKKVLGGEEVKYVEHLTYKNQAERIIQGHLLPDYRNGSIEGYFAILTDITEELARHEKIKQAEDKFRLFAAKFKEVIWTTDLSFKVTFTNDNTQKVFGLTASESIGMSLDQMFPEHSRQQITHIFNQQLNKLKNGEPADTPVVIEVEAVHKKNHLIWVEIEADFLFNENHQPVGLAGLTRDISERKSYELELAKRKEQLQLVWDISVDGFLILNRSGTIKEVNPKYCEMVAMSRDQLINQPFTLVYPPEFRNKALENFKKLFQLGDLEQVFQVEFHRWDGKLVFLDARIKEMQYEGEWAFLYCIRDITRQKEDEIKLRKSEEFFRLFADNSSDLITMFEDESPVYASPSIKDLLGYEPDEFLQLNHLDLIHPEDREKVIAQIRQSKTKKFNHRLRYIYRQQHKCGKYRWLETFERKKITKGNKVITILNTRDITEQKVAEENLKKEERKLKLIAQNIDQVVWLRDNQQFHYISPAFEKIWEISLDSLRLNPDYFIHSIHQEDLPRIKEKLKNTQKNQGKFDEQYRIITPDKKIKWIWARTIQVEDNPHLRVGVAHDITAIKNYEEQLIQANEELDSFVYRVSHDLRAPITSALGLSRLMQVEKDINEINQYAQLQERSLLKLDHFIREILDYSRNSRLFIQKSEIDFKALIEEIVTNLNQNSEYAKIRFQLKMENNYQFVSDAFRIKVIMNNLIANAFKFRNPYISRQLVEVQVTMGPTTQVKIIDNGQGIAEEHHGKIFEMFYRATQMNSGSGIGLYIVRESLKKIHGKIEVQSIYGEGSTFILTLPDLKNMDNSVELS